MYKVFLSSTSRDLAAYRDAVHRAIDGLPGFQLVKMEDFGARDESAKELCERLVRECNLLVGLVGHYYGSTPPGETTSFTELEYRTAKAAALSRLMFVAPGDFPIPANLREFDAPFERQQAFREEVMAERVVASFATPEQLASAVTQALYVWDKEREKQGEGTPQHEAPSTGAERDRPLGPNPYRGLEAFRKEDADRFFGRDAVVQELWERFLALHAPAKDGEARVRLLAILGPSGTGKSSVAQAGLLAKLDRHPLPGRPSPRAVILTPEARPLESLAAALVRQATAEPSAKAVADFEEVLKKRPGHDGLRFLADRMLAVGPAGIVILVDQFEEVFALCRDEAERASFIANLLSAAAEPAGRVSLILTLRTDFIDATRSHPELNDLISRQNVVVPVMQAAALRQVIAEPARRAGREIHPDTVERLVEETIGREGALPLLEFVLTRIWDGFANDSEAAATLQQLGGVGGALARKAAEIYACLDEEEQAIARRAFLAMVQLGEGTRETRRRAQLCEVVVEGESSEAVLRVMRRFSEPDCRLVTIGDSNGEKMFEVTHEALFVEWLELRAWLDEGHDEVRLKQRLNYSIWEWMEAGEPEGLLWRQPLLDLIKSFAEQRLGELTAMQQAFLSKSVENERLRLAEKQKLVNEALTAQSRYLSSAAREVFSEGDAELSLLLILESIPKNLTLPERSLLDTSVRELATIVGAFPIAVLEGHRYILRDRQLEGRLQARFSPDGRYLVTASPDRTARVWDAETGATIAILEGHRGSVRTAVFSPDGARVLTASDDGTAMLWNPMTGQEMAVLRGHGAPLWSAAFDADGAKVVTASEDETARIWHATSGKLLVVLRGHEEQVLSASFGPVRATVLTTSSDGTARLWDAAHGKELWVLRGHTDSVVSASFSPDGARFATWSHDGTARLWTSDGQALMMLSDKSMHDVLAAAWSPNGRYFATVSVDGAARLWDTVSGIFRTILEVEEDFPRDVAFSPDGRFFAISGASLGISDDGWGGAVIFDLDDDEVSTTLCHSQADSATFSPDGAKVVTTSLDCTARVWRVFQTTRELINYARSIVPRELTREERTRFFLE